MKVSSLTLLLNTAGQTRGDSAHGSPRTTVPSLLFKSSVAYYCGRLPGRGYSILKQNGEGTSGEVGRRGKTGKTIKEKWKRRAPERNPPDSDWIGFEEGNNINSSLRCNFKQKQEGGEGRRRAINTKESHAVPSALHAGLYWDSNAL